ncbi:MAG: ATP-binding cassette domain-containing protein [Bradymonadales bacterium]|nr:ATP-binding cassette domain-containing protein [Bradymonadales bacterium]
MSHTPTPTPDSDIIIDIKGLKSAFGSVVIHEGLDLQVRRGEIVGIVGGSGTGKTVLLRQITLLTEPAGGSIRLFGEEIVGISQTAANRLRRRFGMMFQQGALFSSLTVGENVAVPLREHTRLPGRLIEEICLLKVLLSGLPADATHKLPKQLSGGMLKRAAVARALALDPALIFLDEPSSGLDPISAASLDDLILQLRESLGLTFVMVSHDLDSLWRITDRVAFLGDKKIVELANMQELSQSSHPLIREYFSNPRARAAKERA